MKERRKKGRKKGITARWIAVSLLTTVAILAAASVMIVVLTRRNYYEGAQQALEYRINLMLAPIASGGASPDAQMELLRDAVGNYADKGKFEVMLINERGNVIATSSGFAYHAEEPLDDFYLAASAENGQGVYIGRSRSGEHIIAMTQMLARPAGDIEAVRFVSALTRVDASIVQIIQIDITVCLVVIAFTLLSGIYFIRSIVNPLGEIGENASRIAEGDYSVRIENIYNDEIGDLCDIINDMAAGLSVTDRIKHEFISSVSHELRTPLTAIKGWGETLVSVGACEDAVFEKGMDIIISETERLSVLVEDLLDFSRLQSGGSIQLEMERLDLGAELRETMTIFEQRTKNLQLRFELTEGGGPLTINGDKNRMRQVFSNLIDNAIKYSGTGGVIHILAERRGEWVCAVVSDNGIGIPPDELDSITERFYKAGNSVTGSGIGLSVVREIVERHSGTLEFSSELGRGTDVTVLLPVAD